MADRVKLRRKDIPMMVLRLAIAIGLIIFFIPKARSIDFSPLYMVTTRQLFYLFVIKTAIYFITAYRLSVIFRHKNMPVPLGWVFVVNKIGLLISYLVPSSVLSDVGKIFFFRKFNSDSVKILVAIFLDRVSGLLCILLVLAGASAAIKLQSPEQFERIYFQARLIKATLLIGFGIAAIVVPLALWKVGVFRSFFKKHFSFLNAALGWKLIVLSTLGHILFCFLIVEGSRIATTVKLEPLDAAIIFPMSAIATTVPTTPGSIGVGQMVYKYLIDTLTVTDTDSGVLLFTLLQILDLPLLVLALIGALYMGIRKENA